MSGDRAVIFDDVIARYAEENGLIILTDDGL